MKAMFYILVLVFVFAFVVGVAALMAFLLQMVWNAVAVPMGAPFLSYWLALAIWVLLGAFASMLRGSSGSSK